jgi:hypothetical protein
MFIGSLQFFCTCSDSETMPVQMKVRTVFLYAETRLYLTYTCIRLAELAGMGYQQTKRVIRGGRCNDIERQNLFSNMSEKM